MALQRSALWAVALAAVAMALPAPARGDDGGPLLDDGLANYFAAAQAHWGGPLPTCIEDGVRSIPVHALLYDDPDPEVAARAEQPGCRIWLDRRIWREMRPLEACTVVVHEWGHLLGYGHVEDPLDLMAEFPGRPPRECAALGRQARRARASGGSARPCATRRKRLRGRSARRARAARFACIRRAVRKS
jgi:hypothetical protein